MFNVLKHDKFVYSNGHNHLKETDIGKKTIEILVTPKETTISLTKEGIFIRRIIKWLIDLKL